MTDILLTLCPPWGRYLPPIGTAVLASHLAGQGFSVACRDLNVELFGISGQDRFLETVGTLVPYLTGGRELASAWDMENLHLWDGRNLKLISEIFRVPVEAFVEDVLAANPRSVGFSIYRENLHFSLRVAQRLRERTEDIAVVFGGPWLPQELDRSIFPPDVVDFFVYGEGEITLARLLDRIRDQGRPAPGSLAEDERFVPGESPRDLDAQPWPDYRALDLSPYLPGHVSIIASRGCPFRCPFCSDRLSMGAHRLRSVDHVIAELNALVGDLGMRLVTFNDLLINTDGKHLGALCEAIAESGLEIVWDANAVIHRNLTPGLLASMRAGGCRLLQFGLESGSDRVLSLMRKPFTASFARDLLARVREADIAVKVNLIAGYPGETDEDFQRTLDFIARNAGNIGSVGVLSTFHLIRHTEIWERRAELGIEPDDAAEQFWEDPHGNTLGTRLERTFRIMEVCEKAGIPVEQTNAFSDQASLREMQRDPKRGSVLPLGECSLTVQGGQARFAYRRHDLTRGGGMAFDLRLPGQQPFGSGEAVWTDSASAGEAGLFSEAAWGDNHFFVWQGFEGPGEDRATWRLLLQADDAVEVERFNAHIALNPNYRRIDGPWGAIDLPPLGQPTAGKSKPRSVMEADLPLELTLRDALGESLPALTIRAEHGAYPAAAVLWAGPEPRLDLTVEPGKRLAPGTHELLTVRMEADRDADRSGAGPLTASSEGARLEILDGFAHLWLDGVRITGHVGLNLDIEIPGGGKFVSPDAAWTNAWRREDESEATASLRWDAGGPDLWQTFRLAGRTLEWEAYIALEKELDLDRIKAGLVVGPQYTQWRCGDRSGEIPSPSEPEAWRPIGPADDRGRLPLSEGYVIEAEQGIGLSGEGVPDLVLERDPGSLLRLPVIQADCGDGGYAGFYNKERHRYQPGVRLLFRLRLRPVSEDLETK